MTAGRVFVSDARADNACFDEAPASTVEALAYSLRAGVDALSRKDVRQRLSGLDEIQLRAMCARLQRRNGRIAPPWPDAGVELLIEVLASVMDDEQITAKITEFRKKSHSSKAMLSPATKRNGLPKTPSIASFKMAAASMF